MRTRTIPHLWLLGVLTSSKSRQFLFDFFWTPCADSLSKCPFFSAIASADIEYYRHVIFDNSLTPDTCFYSSAIANGHDTSKCAPSAMAIGKGLRMGSRGAGYELPVPSTPYSIVSGQRSTSALLASEATLARQGEVTAIQIGKLWRFRASALNEWLNKTAS